jgi:hypothetical protein
MRKSSNPADTAYSASHNFIKKTCLEKIHNNAPFPVESLERHTVIVLTIVQSIPLSNIKVRR